MRPYAISDRDFAAFQTYAQRELSFDHSARQAVDANQQYNLESIKALRELNLRMLIKETRPR